MAGAATIVLALHPTAIDNLEHDLRCQAAEYRRARTLYEGRLLRQIVLQALRPNADVAAERLQLRTLAAACCYSESWFEAMANAVGRVNRRPARAPTPLTADRASNEFRQKTLSDFLAAACPLMV